MTTYKVRAEYILLTLDSIGLAPEILQRIGGFVVMYGLFEIHFERAIWAIRGEDNVNKRPWTDSKPISAWLSVLDQNSGRFSGKAFEVIVCALEAIKNTSDYRHGIIHGALMPFGDSMSFIRNPKWGNIQRGKPTTDSHVDVNLLDLALDCIRTLYKFAEIVTEYKDPNSIDDKLLRLYPDLRRCHSQAYELINLTALMNHEKY